MSAAISYVQRIPRSDEAGSFILARVSRTGPVSRLLDAKLVATEGAAPYVVHLQHGLVDKLREDNAPCSPDEWEKVLGFILFGQGALENVEAIATVQEESKIDITIRKKVQNITQRLGTLSLAHDENEEIELFEWCGEVAESRVGVQKALGDATSSKESLGRAVDSLKAQLSELIAVKEASETDLLETFSLLLNEKKAKIREQQKLLTSQSAGSGQSEDDIKAAQAEIKEDEEGDGSEEAAAKTARPRASLKTTRSRTTRGAKRRAASPEEESDSNSGFENRAADREKGGSRQAVASAAASSTAADGEEMETNDDERTTDNQDESTESEPEGVDGNENGGRGGSFAKRSPQADATAMRGAQQAKPTPKAPEAPPPRRNLAFGKGRGGADMESDKKQAPPQPAPAARGQDAADSESESDDEL